MTIRVSFAPREGMSIVQRHYGQLCAELYDLAKPVETATTLTSRTTFNVLREIGAASSYEKEKDGRIVAREVQNFRLRHHELDEVAALLADAGFVNVDVCGDYSQEIPAASVQQWLCYSAEVPSGRRL